MQRISEKIDEQENALSRMLRKIIKQKDDSLQKYKIENEELRTLVLQQQELLLRLNNENIQLNANIKYNETKANTNQLDEAVYQDLKFQNQSLEEQLTISNRYKDALEKKMFHVRMHIKTLNKKLFK
jgi:hypothetical protein